MCLKLSYFGFLISFAVNGLVMNYPETPKIPVIDTLHGEVYH